MLRGPWFQAPTGWLSEAGADDPGAQARAAFAAGGGASEGLPVLRGLIRDRDAGVRRAVAVALGRLGTAALPELAVALEDEDPEVRRLTAWALGRPLGPEGVTVLIRALGCPRAGVRLAAARGLQALGGPARDALPALEHAQGDSDEGVARTAKSALAAIDGSLYGKPLRHWIAKLRDPRPGVRRNVTKILVYYAAHELIWVDPTVAAPLPVLVAGLRLPHCENRRMAAEALGRMGRLAVPAIPALRDALRDEYGTPGTRPRVRW